MRQTLLSSLRLAFSLKLFSSSRETKPPAYPRELDFVPARCVVVQLHAGSGPAVSRHGPTIHFGIDRAGLAHAAAND